MAKPKGIPKTAKGRFKDRGTAKATEVEIIKKGDGPPLRDLFKNNTDYTKNI